MKLYIAGPMTGLPDWNYPAFNEAAATLRRRYPNDIYVNPVELDEDEGLDPEDTADYSSVYFDVLARDLRRVMDVDGLVLLPGWEASRGASAEVAIAKALGKEIFLYQGDRPFKVFRELSEQMAGESEQSRRTGDKLFDDETTYKTDPKTGGRKGTKLARYDLVPPEPLAELACVFGMGDIKYPAAEDGIPNWLHGLPYSWHIGAALRHIERWRSGETFDKESGLNHLAHASTLLFMLMTYQARDLGTDDRPCSH